MTSDVFFEILGDVREDFVLAAAAPGKAKQYQGWKWIALAACLCLVVLGGFGLDRYFDQYVERHAIRLYADAEDGGGDSDGCEVSPAQAERLAAGNRYHNLLTAQQFPWYGGWEYDFASDTIRIGLTEFSDANMEAVRVCLGDAEVEFCRSAFSYAYLEEVYARLDARRWLLTALGVERYSIAVSENQVLVYLADAEKSAAICLANEADPVGGAIQFRVAKTHAADGGASGYTPVYTVKQLAVPEEITPADLHVATTDDLAGYDDHMAARYGEHFRGKGIRVFRFAGDAVDANVWYPVFSDGEIARIYYVSRYEGRYITAWSEAVEVGRALLSLAGETAPETPMYLALDGEVLYAVIGEVAYAVPDFTSFAPARETLPALHTEGLDVRTVTFPAA